MDELLVRYLLDDLPADERSAVEARLASDPTVAARLVRLRQLIGGLEAVARDQPVPPPGLAVAAIARTAEHLVAERLFEPDGTAEWLFSPPPPSPAASAERAAWKRWVGDGPVFPSLPRADAMVAAAIGFLAVGIGLTALGKVRQQNQVLACQQNLHGLHTALVGYTDTRAGRFPQVGTREIPVAGALPAELVRAGQLWDPATATCPTASPDFLPAGEYAYTLGYRNPTGQLLGLRRTGGPEPATDWTPLAADPFGPAGSPHAKGQNVLFAGGQVRFATGTTLGGPDGDDIYRNDAGLTRAGLHRYDASLGTASDGP